MYGKKEVAATEKAKPKEIKKAELDRAYKEGRVVNSKGQSIDKDGKRMSNTVPEKTKK